MPDYTPKPPGQFWIARLDEPLRILQIFALIHLPVQLGARADCLNWNSLNFYLTINKRQLVSEEQRTESRVPSRDQGSLPSLQQKLCQKREGASGRGKGGLTLSNKVPPRCIQRVVRTPPFDARTVGLTSAVLVYIRGTKRGLPVERGE